MSEKIKYLQKYTIPSIVPVNDKDLAKYIHISKEAIRWAKRHLKLQLNPEDYKLFLKDAIYAGACLLRAELALGDKLRGIRTKQGMRTDLREALEEDNRTKKEIIIQDFNLTPNQAKQISRLTKYGVEEAINYGEKNNEIPTRALALSFIQEKHRKENNKEPNLPEPIAAKRGLNLNDLLSLKPIRSTTLFANVGICEWFLPFARIHNVIANELLPERIRWHEDTYPDCEMIKKLDKNGEFTGDICDKDIQDEIVKKHIEKGCTLIIATPPCQTFSKAGKRDFSDPRTKLFLPMLDVIRRVNKVNQYVLIENVPEYTKASPQQLQHILHGKTIVEYIGDELKKLGYRVNIAVLNAAHYATPQNRERVIILASKRGVWRFPLPFRKCLTLMDAFKYEYGTIEAGENEDTDFINSAPALSECEVEFLKHTPSGKSAWDNPKEYQPVNPDGTPSGAKHKASFSREDWAKPASTITSDSDYIGGHNTVHPGHRLSDGTYSEARVYTIKEKLILTGFYQSYHNDLPIYKIPDFVIKDKNRKLITEVLGESFLPRLAYYLVEQIPNRKAHPLEHESDFPDLVYKSVDSDGIWLGIIKPKINFISD